MAKLADEDRNEEDEEVLGLLEVGNVASGSRPQAEPEEELELGLRIAAPATVPNALHTAEPAGGSPSPDRIGAAKADAADANDPRGTRQEQFVLDREKAARMRSLYQVWPAQNSFFCKGLLVTGGSDECCAPNICIWACILVPSFLYFGWILPGLFKRGCYALPLATLFVFIMTVGSLLLTCCTDPGILPRREVILAVPGCAAKLEETLGYDVLGMSGGGPDPCIPENLSRQGYRWCRTCNIIRPPRASHCPDCDNCVLRYDHHCPFVNNCVGQRNYHFFFGFVTCVMVLAVMVLPALFSFFAAIDLEASLKFMISVSSAMWVAFYALIACGALVVIAATGSLLLWLYHVFLIVTNRTTKEYRRSLPNVTEEPTLCARRGPRLFDPWAQVDPRALDPLPRKSYAGISRRDERYHGYR